MLHVIATRRFASHPALQSDVLVPAGTCIERVSPPSRSGSAGGGRTARLHCNGSGSGSDSGGGPPPDQWHYTEYSPRAGHPPADWPPRHRLPLVPPLPLPAFEGHPWIILLTRAAQIPRRVRNMWHIVFPGGIGRGNHFDVTGCGPGRVDDARLAQHT